MRKWIAILLVIVAAGAGVYVFSLNRVDHPVAAEMPSTMAVQVSRRPLTKTISASGRLEPAQDVWASFGTTGIVAEINAAVGERVTAGSILGRLDTRDVQIDLIKAQREYEQARLDATESVKEEKRLAYEIAQRKAQGTTATAPFDGLIVEVAYQIGDSASAQSAAFRLIDTSSYRIVVDIDQLDLRHIQVGQDVIVRVDAFSDLRLQGQVTDIGWLPASSSGVVSYPVEVTVSSVAALPGQIVQMRGLQDGPIAGTDDVPIRRMQDAPASEIQVAPPQDLSYLRPGLTVQVDIVIESVNNALVVPLAAVVENGPVAFVTRLNEDGTQEVVPVQTGMSDNVWVEIREGLSDADQVVTNNHNLYAAMTEGRQSGGSRPSGGAFVGGTFGTPIGGAIRLPAMGR